MSKLDELTAELEGQAPGATPTDPAAQPVEQPGVVQRVARDVGLGTVMAPLEAARGGLTGLQETAQTLGSIADALPGGSTRDTSPSTGVLDTVGRYAARPLDAVSDAIGAARDLIPQSGTVTGGLVGGIGQFLAGNLIGGKVLKAFGLANRGGAVAQALGRDVVGSAIAFDPHEARLSNLLRDHAGLRDPITAYLAADPLDSEAEGRFKSAIENGALGAAGEALFHAVRGLRATRNGNLDEAITAADDAEKAVGPEESRRLISEELKVRETRESWLRVAERTTTEDTTRTVSRDQASTANTRTTAEAPEGTVQADPHLNVPAVGGEGRVAPARLNEADATAILTGWEKARANPEAIDRDTALVFWRNLDRIETTDDAVKLLDQMQTRFQGFYEKAHGTAINLDEQRRIAQSAAENAVDAIAVDRRQRQLILDSLAARHEDVRKAAAEAEVARAVSAMMQRRLSESADEVIRVILHGKGAEAVDKDKLLATFMRDASFLNNVDALQGGLGTAFARALAMRRSVFVDAPAAMQEGELAQAGARGRKTVTERISTTSKTTHTETTTGTTKTTVEQLVEGGERTVLELAYRLRYAQNTKQARKIVAKGLEGPGAWDAAGEYWMGSLLSSAKTYGVGAITSSFRTLVQNPGEKMVAGLLQGTLGRATGGALTGGEDFHLLREGFNQYRGYLNSFREAVSLASRAMREGDSIIDPNFTQIEAKGGAFQASAFGQSGESIHGWLINSLGSLARVPNTLLMGQDEFFKVLTYRGSIYAQARREGADMGLSGASLDQHISARLDASYEATTGRPTDDAALAAARNITFTDEFGEGFISRMGAAVQAAKARNGALQVLLPFVRVPTNVLREGMTYNPIVALAQKEFRQEIAAGGDRAGMAWARLGTGTAMAVLLYDLASQGRITGNGPSDPKARSAWQQYGWQPNSVAVDQPDGSVKYVSYARFDPYATLFSVMSSMAELSQELGQDSRDSRLNDAVMLTVMGAAKALASRTYATGLMQFADMLSGGAGTGEAALNSLAATIVPAAARDLVTLGYDSQHMRQAHSMLDAMKVRTAAFGEVDARYNALGHMVSLPAGWAGTAGDLLPEKLLQVISPATARTRPNDPLATELLRLQQVHYTAFSPPSPNPGGVGIDLTDFRQEGGGTAYGRLQALVGEVKVGGRTLEDRLRQLTTSPRYAQLHDGTADVDGQNIVAVRSVMTDYRNAALQALRKENPEVDAAIRQREQFRRTVTREGGDVAMQRTGRSPAPTLGDLFNDLP